MSGGNDEDYGAGEVLTGAELYLYLLRQNEAQLQRAQEKLREYTALRETLQHLTERSRRRVLAPVAGGLAYYAAELNATNTIMVLLGDGWFAERSATQACEIAGRRVDFLRREVEVLQQEQTTLRTKQDLFLSELPEAQSAVAKLLAGKEAHTTDAVSGSAAAVPLAPPSASDVPSSSGASATAPVRAPPPHPSTSFSAAPACANPSNAAPAPAPAEPGALLDLASIDASLATFDELDELTEDELIALEAELGDRVNDDEYVEQVMTERMIAKKEARVRAELAKRSATSAPTPFVPSAASEEPPAATPVNSPEPVKAVSASADIPGVGEDAVASAVEQPALLFRTPGDIGGTVAALPSSPATSNEVQRALTATPDVADSGAGPKTSTQTAAGDTHGAASPLTGTGDSSSTSSPTSADSLSPRKKERHVRFATDVPGAPQAAVHVDATGTTGSRMATRAPLPLSAPAPSVSAPSSLRSTYTVGDIVEHSEATTTAAAAPLPAMPPPLVANTTQKPKRRSLFMRELEGDSA